MLQERLSVLNVAFASRRGAPARHFDRELWARRGTERWPRVAGVGIAAARLRSGARLVLLLLLLLPRRQLRKGGGRAGRAVERSSSEPRGVVPLGRAMRRAPNAHGLEEVMSEQLGGGGAERRVGLEAAQREVLAVVREVLRDVRVHLVVADAEHGGLSAAEFDERRLAGGALDEHAAEAPDVRLHAVPVHALVDHLRRHVLQRACNVQHILILIRSNAVTNECTKVLQY